MLFLRRPITTRFRLPVSKVQAAAMIRSTVMTEVEHRLRCFVEFGEIRTSGTPDKPLFCLADVCKALGLHPSKVKKRLGERGIYTIYTPTHNQIWRINNASNCKRRLNGVGVVTNEGCSASVNEYGVLVMLKINTSGYEKRLDKRGVPAIHTPVHNQNAAGLQGINVSDCEKSPNGAGVISTEGCSAYAYQYDTLPMKEINRNDCKKRLDERGVVTSDTPTYNQCGVYKNKTQVIVKKAKWSWGSFNRGVLCLR